jgi:TonB family protein
MGSNKKLLIGLFGALWLSTSVQCQSFKQESQPQPPQVVSGHRGAGLNNSVRKRIEPVYPAEAKEQGVKGAVVVEVSLDEKGNVLNAHALIGHSLLREAAVEAVKKWKFKQARIWGKPIKVNGTVTVYFPPRKGK